MKSALVAIPMLALASSLLAQTQVQVPQQATQIGVETITCPERLEGWPYEVISLKNCSTDPAMNINMTCDMWNKKQFSVPSGWEYFDNKRYSSATHVRSNHYLEQAPGNKTFLSCAYTVGPGTNALFTHIIRREAPGGKTCTKLDGFRFRCERPMAKVVPR